MKILTGIYRISVFIILTTVILSSKNYAQDKLYLNEFPLQEVSLKNGQFKSAMDLNIQTLLQYDVDRLLEPFLKEAGLTPKGEPFSNWDGLAGHVGGHYLTAMAINYTSTGNEECKERLDYMLSELKKCQDANGYGYLGGIPGGRLLWADVKNGNFTRYKNAWVPWYNIHKTYAGLRDAWLYGSSVLAKDMFLDLCDWGIDIISGLSYSQMQTMLDTEFGGMNEVYADAYQITGDIKYLDAAKRFTHYTIFNPLVAGSDKLDNLHANTQIPKIIGFARIAQLDPSATDYANAAKFFWETVVNNRSLAIGGNSRSEHFPSVTACEDYVTSREGPESCNTYNMLKLTEQLFKISPDAKYIDYYERALYNHILSTQNPEHGGYVYFTPARPRHYRVYSAVNQAMWCCVGSGMENHGKYGQMIYSHFGDDSLFVNLFIPSILKWEEKGIEIEQTTSFPDEETTNLTFNSIQPASLKLFIRYPGWVKNGELEISINGEPVNIQSQPGSYILLERNWNQGDVVSISLPMHFEYEELPNEQAYIAFFRGPVLLGAKTGNEGLVGLVADDGRWSHIASGELLPLNAAPVIEGERDSILNYFNPVTGKSLTFQAPELFPNQKNYQSIEFEPFARIHDSRYMMYWMSITSAEYQAVIQALDNEEKARLELDRRTVDKIATGEQQPDADHALNGDNTYNGVYNDEYYRDARVGGYFSYEMATGGNTNLTLMVRYWGNENGARTFDILIDEVVIATENISGKWGKNEFKNVEYSIPKSLLEGKETITVKFKAKANNYAGGVFYLRLLKPDETQSYIESREDQKKFFVAYNKGKIILKTITNEKLLKYNLFSCSGKYITSGNFFNNEASIDFASLKHGMYLLQYNTDEVSSCTKVAFYK